MAKEAREPHRKAHPWETRIKSILAGLKVTSMAEVLTAMGLEFETWPRHNQAVADILRTLGCKRKKTAAAWLWDVPEDITAGTVSGEEAFRRKALKN